MVNVLNNSAPNICGGYRLWQWKQCLSFGRASLVCWFDRDPVFGNWMIGAGAQCYCLLSTMWGQVASQFLPHNRVLCEKQSEKVFFGQLTSEKLMKQYECHLKGGQWCRHWLERCDDDNDCEDDEHNVDNVCTRRWWHWMKITTMTIVTMKMTARMMKVMLTMFARGEDGIEDNNDNNTNSDDDNENVDNVCTSSHLCCFLLQSQQKPPLSI